MPSTSQPARRRESLYAASIRKAPAWRLDIDPRHVEAFMRLEHSTLDGLSALQFNEEVAIAVECVRTVGKESAEETARSFDL